MKINLTLLTLLAAFSGPAAGQRSEIATGRTHYTEGEFKKAAAYFQLALKTDPNSAESYYWMGMSYQRLADIALPFWRQVQRKGPHLPDKGSGTGAYPSGLPRGAVRIVVGSSRILAERLAAGGRDPADGIRIRSRLQLYARALREREQGQLLRGSSTRQAVSCRSAGGIPHRGIARGSAVETAGSADRAQTWWGRSSIGGGL